mgnify:FL=1
MNGGIFMLWKKWIGSILLILGCTLLVNEGNAQATTFTDVNEKHPSVLEIEFLADTKIIKGYPDQTFKPFNHVTNSQVALMISRALELDLRNRPNPGFNDLSRVDDETYKAIAAVVDEGIFPKGQKFRPYEPITRGEMASVLVNAFKLKGTQKEFKDVSANNPYYKAIKTLAASNITTGYEDGTFKPASPLTRAHFSTFMSRIMEPDFIPVSSGYQYNKNYHYVYEYNDLDFVGKDYFTYKQTDKNGDRWFVSSENGQGLEYISIVEKKGFTFKGLSQEIIDFHIPYPVKLGASWSYSYMKDYSPVTYAVTSMSEKLSTPAGTFDRLIEIVSSDGYVFYYSPEYGHIRTYDLKADKVVYELVSLKKR